MTEWYKNIKRLDLSKWVITKFYHYASICQDIFGEFDTCWHSKPVGDHYLKDLYDYFLEIANVYYRISQGNDKCNIYDNKTTIEITNIEDGSKLYISSKDGRYLIGKSVWSEFGSYTEFGVIKK